MSSAEERKRAKEAYMAVLAQQRQSAASKDEKTTVKSESKPPREVTMSKREKMLEERRRQFLEKQRGNDTVSANSKESNRRSGVDTVQRQQVVENDTQNSKLDVKEQVRHTRQDADPSHTNDRSDDQSRNVNSRYNNGSEGLSNMDTSEPMDDKMAKRAKQAEYARQLESQMHQQPVGNNRGASNDQGMFGRGPSDPMDDKMAKRAKQAEYARQLESQMHQKSNNDHRSALQNQQSQYGDGWVMGPLGVPVRATLAVGNRGVQKAYVSQVQSPQKLAAQGPWGPASPRRWPPESVVDARHDTYGAAPQNPNLFQQNPHYPAAMQGYGDGIRVPANGLGIENVDDDRNRQHQIQKMQHAKALEDQIRAKKAKDLEDKKKEEEEEMRQMQKLEKERQEIQAAYEIEQQKLKAKAEEERKEALRIQIEQKKIQKEAEEAAQREIERKENERIAREQEELRKRQEEEIRRERGIPNSSSDPPPRFGSPTSSIPDHSRANVFRPPSPIIEVHSHAPEEIKSPNGYIAKGRNKLFSPPSPAKPPVPRQESPPLPAARAERNLEHSSGSSRRGAMNRTPDEYSQDSSPPSNSRVERKSLPQRGASNSSGSNRRGAVNRTSEDHLRVDHPIIKTLQEETAIAKEEAKRAREELAQLRKLVSDGKKKGAQRNEPVKNEDSRMEASLVSNSIHTPFTTTDEIARNDFDGELDALDRTLESNSRFVYPNGASFLPQDLGANIKKEGRSNPGVLKVPPLPVQQNHHSRKQRVLSARQEGTDQHRLANDMIKEHTPVAPSPRCGRRPRSSDMSILQTSHNSDLCTSERAHNNPDLSSTLRSLDENDVTGVGTDRVLSQHRDRKPHPIKHSISGPSSTAIAISGTPGRKCRNNDALSGNTLEFDVDRAFRRNRRKWELLEGMALGGESGAGREELELLMGGLGSVSSSRPTTRGGSSPSREQPLRVDTRHLIGGSRGGQDVCQLDSLEKQGGGFLNDMKSSMSMLQLSGRSVVEDTRCSVDSIVARPHSVSDVNDRLNSPGNSAIDYSEYGL